ncbi:MAG: radical SAM protein [Nanoarchaeota archaeon]
MPRKQIQILQKKKAAFYSNAKENNKGDWTKTSYDDFMHSRQGFTKQKLLLVIPNIVGDKIAATAPLPGVAYIAGFVREAGHDVAVFDMRVDRKMDHLFKKIQELQPDFIGLSFMTQHEFEKIYDFVAQVREKVPDAKIIIGGAGASALFDKVLRDTTVDYCITREGEYSLVELMDGVLPLDSVSGLIWKNGSELVRNQFRKFELAIDDLPFPAYDLFPMQSYVDRKIPVVTSRGCPYLCTFCANKASMGVAWRPRSPENILKELTFWHAKGFRQFHFVDDNFTLDMRRAEKICDLIIASGMKIRWDLRNGIRVDKVNELLLQKMKQSGCFYFALGIEHIDQDVLDRMKKNLKAEVIEPSVQLAEKVGIPFGGFFIVGLLGDTYEKFLRVYDFARHHNFSEVRFYNPMPFPGTELYEELVEKKLLVVEPTEYLNHNSKFKNEPVFATPEFTIAERKKALKMGQKLVMEKFLKKEFGTVIGSLAVFAWNLKFLNSVLQPVGITAWKMMRRLKRTYVSVEPI